MAVEKIVHQSESESDDDGVEVIIGDVQPSSRSYYHYRPNYRPNSIKRPNIHKWRREQPIATVSTKNEGLLKKEIELESGKGLKRNDQLVSEGAPTCETHYSPIQVITSDSREYPRKYAKRTSPYSRRNSRGQSDVLVVLTFENNEERHLRHNT
ncbi:unnamed protein product [Trichogramma brassicae]|uniref:Uncharacterized protein n=1 Tax=Trichogramma brassicae TaxID=86971 RepID=A0A6H5IUA2_9HYME|nr:unnamed protein product [Trichogramma brassicae]